MLSRADMNEAYADYARPGGWNGLNFTTQYISFCLCDDEYHFDFNVISVSH